MEKLLKNKNGMTLTELLVGIIIFSLVTTIISTMLISALRVYESANDIAEYNAILDNIANRIVSDLASSTDIPEFNGANGGFTVVTDSVRIEYSVDTEGFLLRNGSRVFADSYYNGKKIEIGCAPYSPDGSYIVTITVFSNSGAVVSRDYAVKPLVLNQKQPL